MPIDARLLVNIVNVWARRMLRSNMMRSRVVRRRESLFACAVSSSRCLRARSASWP